MSNKFVKEPVMVVITGGVWMYFLVFAGGHKPYLWLMVVIKIY